MLSNLHEPLMPARSPITHALGITLALASTAMIALAAGAVWMVASVYFGGMLAWLSVPVGAALGWAIRASVTGSRPLAVVLASAATWLAAVYMLALNAAMQVAGLMGMSFTEALHRAGPGMLFDIASQKLPSMSLALIAGILTAALIGARRRRR